MLARGRPRRLSAPGSWLRNAALLLGIATSAPAQDIAPSLVQGRTAEVLVSASAGRDTVSDDARLGALVTACRRSVDISAQDSARFVRHRPAAPALSTQDGRGSIVLSVRPRHPAGIDCTAAAQSTLAGSRGLRVTIDASEADAVEYDHVVVRRGDRILRPLVEERVAVMELGARGFRASRASWSRLVFDRDDLAPDPSLLVDDLSIEVGQVAGGESERLPLPWDAVRIAWEASLASHPSTGVVLAPAVPLAPPADPRLRLVHDAYVSGEPERTVRLAVRHSLDHSSPREVRRDARLHAVMALLALGDTASARALSTALLLDAPCLAVDAMAPIELRRFFDGARRPTARCVARSPLRTGVTALLLPGFAMPRSDASYDERLLVFIGSVGMGLLAAQRHVVAQERFEIYREWESAGLGEISNELPHLYRNADRARKQSLAAGAVGALVWIGQGIQAVRAERRFADDLRAVQGIGGAVALRVTPQAGPNGLGLSLTLSW